MLLLLLLFYFCLLNILPFLVIFSFYSSSSFLLLLLSPLSLFPLPLLLLLLLLFVFSRLILVPSPSLSCGMHTLAHTPVGGTSVPMCQGPVAPVRIHSPLNSGQTKWAAFLPFTRSPVFPKCLAHMGRGAVSGHRAPTPPPPPRHRYHHPPHTSSCHIQAAVAGLWVEWGRRGEVRVEGDLHQPARVTL